MKLILPILVFALLPYARGQQRLFASTDRQALYEINGYATAPQARLLRLPTWTIGSYPDIAVRPRTGAIFAVEQGVMGEAGVEIDPNTGLGIGYVTCLYTPAGGHFVSSIDCDHSGRLFGHALSASAPGLVSFMTTGPNAYCFTVFGPSVPANPTGDVAFDRDGTLLSTRSGTTALHRLNRVTGAVTPFGDPGVAFAGLEIDTDGTLYGLTEGGALYRVDRTTLVPTFLGLLPTDSYTGLAFREPAGRLDPTLVCTAHPNSSGRRATLRAEQLPGLAPGSVEFQAGRLPPNRFGLLLVSPTTAVTALGSGTLCLGSGVLRASGAHLSGANGQAAFTVDLANLAGHGAVQSGDQLYFQAWFRDSTPAGQVTSNLTAALRVEFLF